jgi:hypothetical protein
LNNFELSATIMTNSSPDHNTSASKTAGLVHTLVRKTFLTPAVHTITSISKTKWKSGFIGVQIHVVFCEQSYTKFGRLPYQVFYGQCHQPLSYGSGGE